MSGPSTNWGHPVAYHPTLAAFFGSINAAIFFGQLRYWSDRAASPLGVYKTAEDWQQETGLSYREQATARKILAESGFVRETHRRLEHRIYFLIDWDAFNAAFAKWASVNRQDLKPSLPNDESAIRCELFPQPVNRSRDYTETQGKNSPNPTGEHVPEGFAKFWECYPSTRKVGKKTCLDKWRKKKLESIADTIIQHVEAMKGTRAWKDGFDPSPQTYLAQERWADGVNVQTLQDQKFAGVI